MNARQFAIAAHGNQLYGSHPYVWHLDQVVGTLCEFGYTDINLLNAGWLHDVLEDTDTLHATLINEFGFEVYDLVLAVTAIGSTREEKTKNTITLLRDCYPEAIPLKMADRLANMRFSSKNSEKMIRRYSQELHKYMHLFEATNRPMYNEMVKLCVF